MSLKLIKIGFSRLFFGLSKIDYKTGGCFSIDVNLKCLNILGFDPLCYKYSAKIRLNGFNFRQFVLLSFNSVISRQDVGPVS